MNEKDKGLSDIELKLLVLDYASRAKDLKQFTDKFNLLKSRFNTVMKRIYDETGHKDKLSFSFNDLNVSFTGFDGTIEVSKVQPTRVTFDVEAVEQALGKKRAKAVTMRRYEVNDMDALILYLKECGVDPKIFRSFITVDKSVNNNAIDHMVETGQVTEEELQGCYTISKSEPYFKVNIVKGKNDFK